MCEEDDDDEASECVMLGDTNVMGGEVTVGEKVSGGVECREEGDVGVVEGGKGMSDSISPKSERDAGRAVFISSFCCADSETFGE